ncbi:3-keto-5-aminohexanoate cleavage protein [Pseudonocardia pini]|uniref:3-keto-5-aminohexanoate cleavage protein n=1 Tax=Pseudonocardia pini TaxID=2758030 RepID=UPI0015F030C6|nr:3-keto-5-aminohexanoate cleavage protein [Pseudonocardia pini]
MVPDGVDREVVVEVAVNGPTPRAVTPHVPRTPAEIAADMIACADLGATILHNHNDEPMFTTDGVHAAGPYVEAWTAVRAAHPDVFLYPTMAAGARGIPVERRWAHVETLAGLGGMTLVDPGSVNVGLTAAGRSPRSAAGSAYQNTIADTEHMAARTVALGAVPSISIFEPGFLRTALTLHRHGRLPVGMVKLYFGGDLQFGLPPTPTALAAYLELLEPAGLPWSVAVLGGDVVGCGLAEHAVRRGGHVRVGLEDHAGERTPRNVELVAELVELLDRLGTRPATPAETRALLTTNDRSVG